MNDNLNEAFNNYLDECDGKMPTLQNAFEAGAKYARDGMASRLIDAWAEAHGGRCHWRIAVQICAIIQKLDDNERDRLLSLDS